MDRNAIDRLVHLALGAAVFAYVLYRSIHVAITYDEAWTILDFVPTSVIEIFSCTPCDANNHLLNTLLIKILFFLGDRSEFLARLPNVIAFAIWIVHAHLIAVQFFRGIARHALFVLLLFNPFVLDLFGLARGYGLALGFSAIGVYQLLLFADRKIWRNALISIAAATLAVLANLAFLNVLLSIILIASWIAWRAGRPTFVRVAIGISFFVLSLAALLYVPLRELISINAFYHGGESGLYNDTFNSLVRYSAYDRLSSGAIHAFTIILLSITALLFIFTMKRSVREKDPLAVIGIALLICLLSIEMQHHLLGTRYVIDRGAIFLYPLWAITFCASLQHLQIHWLRKAIAIGSITILGLNTVQSFNLHRTVLWYFDAHTPEMLGRLDRLGAEKGEKLVIHRSWPLRSALRYYTETRNYDHVEVVAHHRPHTMEPRRDHFYLFLDRSLDTAPYDVSREPIDPARCDTLWSMGDGIHVLTDLEWVAEPLSYN